MKNSRHFIYGIVAGIALSSVYFGMLTVLNSFEHALSQFIDMWYWILLLVVGFSIQVGLYAYIKGMLKSKAGIATSSVAAAGGISTTSMIACCAHHVTDVLPIIGLSAAAIFLNKFQLLFIVTGVLSNLIGISIMLKIIQEHSLYYQQNNILSHVMKLDMKNALYAIVSASALAFIAALIKTLGV
ncbi:hypothetical protein J4231_00010 [Candidatus Woesearchaeota archaeon]|nr:hypothetical protein [Candidatus Woesearchaeota archaeon]